MITFMESREPLEENEDCLDSQLWHACAGNMVQMPWKDSKVYYFPQGHSEHASRTVDFRTCPRIPACVPCLVSEIRFKADLETDEVYVKLRLVPFGWNEVDFDDGIADGGEGSDNQEKLASFSKTLTQSDANNGGGFSVPRYCAETIFPPLDFTADPPVQTILAKDVHGRTWKFRHIYRGTPRRHLLTTGWSVFVNQKKLVAGDSIVFMRAESGDLCVGIRRAKRGIAGGPEIPMGWNSFSGETFFREDESQSGRKGNGQGKVKPEDVIEAATRVASRQPFDVVYYPRASTPEFCVKASLVKAALQIRWCSGMRFKMAFETEDSSRISWFMGTVSVVQTADPVRWLDSPWRLLMVSWDEPELLQNVKRVNPWQVELVPNMPAIEFSPFSPRKRLRYPEMEFAVDNQGNHNLGFHNPLGHLHNNPNPAGMQGARQAQYGFPLSDLHINKFQFGSFRVGFPPLNRAPVQPSGTSGVVVPNPSSNENVSCLLTMGNPSQGTKTMSENRKAASFVLFGQPILTEKQITMDTDKMGNTRSAEGFQLDLGLETGHCKVSLESDDVGRTLDLSVLDSYEELYRKLANMFDIEISEMLNRILYRDASGAVRQIGNEPFRDFTKIARRLTILADSISENLGI